MRKLFVLALITLLLPVSILCEQNVTHIPVALTNITVIDMTGAPPKRGMTVVISKGRILTISAHSKIKMPKNTEVIDCTGKFLVPAFWDMHVHALNSDRMLPLFLANGVLGIRDLGSPSIADVLRWRDEAGVIRKILDPRIVTAGRVIDGDPPANPDFSVTVKNPGEARKAVRDLKAQKVDLLKVYDGLTREAYLAIVAEAKRTRLPFAGHVPLAVTSIEASDAGQRSIEHLGKLMEDSSAEPDRIRAKRAEPIKEDDFFAFTDRFGRINDEILATYSDKRARAILARFRRNKTWQVPTLVTKNSRTFIDELDAKGDPRSKYVEASQLNYWKPEVGFFSRYRTPGYISSQKRYFQKELELVGAMQRFGVPILAGSDAPNAYVIAGFSLHDELALLVKAGLTPMQALATATRNPAEYLGELSSHGTVQTGKIANLIVLDADPLKDITNTTKINAVIQKGWYLSRDKLDIILANVETAANKAVN